MSCYSREQVEAQRAWLRERPDWLTLLWHGKPQPIVGWCVACRAVVPQLVCCDGYVPRRCCAECKREFWKPATWPCLPLEQLPLLEEVAC